MARRRLKLPPETFVVRRRDGLFLDWRNCAGRELPKRVLWTDERKEAWVLYEKGRERVTRELKRRGVEATAIAA